MTLVMNDSNMTPTEEYKNLYERLYGICEENELGRIPSHMLVVERFISLEH